MASQELVPELEAHLNLWTGSIASDPTSDPTVPHQSDVALTAKTHT